MDAPRHVLRALFRDTAFPLVDHHLSSFNALLEKSIPTFMKVSNPYQLELVEKEKGNRYIRVYLGGKEGNKVSFQPPVDEHGSPIVPHACRLDNTTYALTLVADIVIEYVFGDGKTETRTFENIDLGRIPLMLRSRPCYLTAMDGYSVGECQFELGGYFIIEGSEKVLMTQELLGNNMFYSGIRSRTSVAKDTEEGDKDRAMAAGVVAESSFEGDKETYVGIRSISEDGSKGPYSHFLILPPENAYNSKDDPINLGRNRRNAVITLPGFTDPVPILSVFACLGLTSDREIYDTVLAGVPDKDRLAYDDIFTQLVISHQALLKIKEKTDLELLEEKTKRKYKSEVIENIYELLFPHVEGADVFRRKAYLLGQMLRMALDVTLGRKEPSDRDNIQFKRFIPSGGLMFQEFRRIYRVVAQEMLLKMDQRIQYERKTYEGANLVKLVERETIGYFWKPYRMLNEFSKSFKGQWGGRDGVAQELNRLSYVGYLSQLRRTILQISPDMNTAPPRRLYASQFGLTCPVDSPDGSGVGHIKSLAILARVSTAFPSEVIKALIFSNPMVRRIENVLPGTWEPFWTPIYINSDLVGVCLANTESLHNLLMTARRNGQIQSDVSLGWNKLANVYTIACDAGRPVRPMYREGVSREQVLAATSWNELTKLMDYVDAQESDVSRFSLEPFHPAFRSEIHMTFCMSPIANLVPFLDHNPATRNDFAIAQQKQACSWYHTNYNKRFDTISSITTNPQKPLCHTWFYREMMGSGGCMPYGENALVAFTMYGGHNQEDSMILNQTSLKRGMFRTAYFHSYDIQEEMIDPASMTQTMFGNPITNAKYEAVKRKEDVNYEMLDGDGIIKLNSIINDKTVLVGMLSPIKDAEGNETGFRDVSELPKRGQHGRVDAIYHYAMSGGIRGVKIRIVEERSPQPGDKMASRHSQKGTVGQLIPESDMPFTSKGVRPDIIFNPHGIPTRMTIGQFLESTCSKVGLQLGSFVDATGFTVSNRIADLKEAMIARGFEPYGHETLYNGMTGEMMEADIFMGPIYYQRLKHMVEDKINYRSTGPRTLLTHQPLHGRSKGGGLAVGEMERDGMVAHGISKFLHESFMDRSDGVEVQIDNEGRLDTSKNTIAMPYAMSLFVKELESAHIDVKLITE
jgi:DNA-directed RNA polymerase II subunit RPB2